MSESAVIRIFQSELDRIKDCVVASPDIETGGELIGLWSHGDSPTVLLSGVTVMLASGPSKNSKREPTYFQQNAETHMQLERAMWEGFGMQVVGMWHSHHRLGLHQLSPGDVRRTRTYSIRHSRPRYSEILAYLIETDEGGPLTVGLRPHVYSNAASGIAVPTSLEVLDGESPMRRSLAGRSLPRDVQHVIRGRLHVPRAAARHVIENHEPGGGSGTHEPVRAETEHRDRVGATAAVETPPSSPEPSPSSQQAEDHYAGRVAQDSVLLQVIEQAIRAALPDQAAKRLQLNSPAPDVLVLSLLSPDGQRRLVFELQGHSGTKMTVRSRVEYPPGKLWASYVGEPATDADLACALRDTARQIGY